MTKRFGMSRKDYSGSVLKLLSLLFPILLISVAGCVPPPGVPPEVSEGIKVIIEERDRAEHYVLRLKDGYAKDTNEYKDGGGLYTDAQGAFNAWIGQIEFGLRAGIILKNQTNTKSLLRRQLKKAKSL